MLFLSVSRDMDTTMIELRSFVHQRMYAAAEEILGEVEKTVTFALYEAEVSRSKEELESLRHQLSLLPNKSAERPLTGFTAGHIWDTSGLQETPRPPTQLGPGVSAGAEVPGPSRASTDLEKNNWTYCMDETAFRIPDIKEEQEEDIQENFFTSAELYYPKTHASATQPGPESEASDTEEVLSHSNDDQIGVMQTKEKFLQGQGGQDNVKRNEVVSSKSQSGKRQKDHSFCHKCGKGFQYMASLKKHIKTLEIKKDCGVCGLIFQTKQKLISHLQRFHKRTLFCNTCCRTFVNSRSLKKHKNTHTGVKEFVCQTCGRTFYRRDNLTVHVRTHSREKAYHCDICGKGFTQSQNVAIHERSHSGDKPYHCSMCGNRFTTSGHLKKHMMFHLGEKPYQCDICGRPFQESGELTLHRAMHTEERPFACCICGLRYRFATNLKLHMKTHVTTAPEATTTAEVELDDL